MKIHWPFFKSCKSEGLISKGLRRPFTLAANVNDECFVNLMQMECDRGSSRILDRLMKVKGKTLRMKID